MVMIMNYQFDDILNGRSSNSTDNYTLEEIEAAKKRQKKKGGTFLENLQAIAPGKGGSKPSTMDFSSFAESKPTTVQKPAPSAEDISSTIRDLNQNIYSEFGLKEAAPPEDAGTLQRFSGLTEALEKQVLGQQEFLKKLTIAFKRPYVTERDDNDALNTIYITGPNCTGKHSALNAIVTQLNQRGILGSNQICTMDLSLYPSSTEEKLFLQDLYSSLQSKAAVLVFEHFEACHVSLLTRLSDLVTTGECRLSERYMLQNGQLIHVANAFAGNTVGSFTAKGKYLVFISNKPLDKLAGIMGAPFVNALGDICTSAALDEETMKQISENHEKLLLEKCKRQLQYDVSLTDSFREYILTHSSRGRGLRGILDFYVDIQKALAELRLERDDLGTDTLLLQYTDAPLIIAGQEEIALSTLLPEGYRGELESVRAELSDIVGLQEIKEYIYSLEEYFDVQKRRREAGLKAGEVNKHMIFTGNPGTGKTTIARIVSKYLKAIGVLSGGQLVEVSRADLVGRYVGHTAPLVNQVIKSALGGVLFIDEAYSLYRGKDDSFGLEAIDTLVKGIEDNRDDLIVILAGYSQEMEEFLEANSGLKSRFPNIIDFPDYTGEELLAICRLTAKSKGYCIDPAAEEALLTYFNQVQATRAQDAGNGRLVRNKLEEAILNQSRRLVAMPEADISLLLEMDFELDH